MIFKKIFQLLVFCLPTLLVGQDTLPQAIEEEAIEEVFEENENVDDEPAVALQHVPPPPAQPVALRQIEEEKWKKAAGNLDYSADRPEPPKPKKEAEKKPDAPRQNWDVDWNFWAKFWQVVAILLVVAGLGFTIYKMSEQPQNFQLASDGTPITFENVEEYLHESDLERFLRQAKEAKNYPAAVRIYFLMILKSLSESGKIEWSKEKTNRFYLREMRLQPQSGEFREVVRVYERVWYGDARLSETDFFKIEEQMRRFLA